MPFYGVDRRTLRLRQNIEDFDYVCLGHFHSLNFLQPSGMPILMNGTFVSGGQYPLYKMGLSERPQQWVFGVHPVNGIAWMYAINLS